MSTLLLIFVMLRLYAPLLAAQTPQPPALPTAAQVIARHVQAIGGEKAIRSVKFRHLVIKTSLTGTEGEDHTEVYIMSPNRIYIRSTNPRTGAEEAGSDGKTSWSIYRDVPELASSSLRRHLIIGPDLAEPLHKYVKSMSVIGSRKIDGRNTVAVAIASDDGGKYNEYFDVETGLLTAMGNAVSDLSADKGPMMIYGDYQSFDGILIATRQELRYKFPRNWPEYAFVMRTVSVSHSPIARSRFVPPPAVRALASKRSP